MDDYIPSPEAKVGGGNSVFLFLSLYLLILAFFILLVSISTIEEVKQKAAIESVTTTFTNIVPPATQIMAISSEEGDVDAGQVFQEKITGIFATSLRLAKVEIVQPGRLMRVQVPTETMFFKDKSEIKPSQSPLLDRLVLALSERPAGVRHDLELVIGSPYVGEKSLPIGETLELARTGVLARDLLARGAPPDSIAIGIKPGNPNEINIWLYTRSVEEMSEMFKKLGKPKKIITKKNNEQKPDVNKN